MNLNPIAGVRRALRKTQGLPSFSKEDDPERFKAAVRELFARIKKAVIPLQRANDVFVLTTTEDCLKIELSADRGFYTLEPDEDQLVLHYLSPITGRSHYELNFETNEWINPEDGQELTQLLTRDLSRQCEGTLTF